MEIRKGTLVFVKQVMLWGRVKREGDTNYFLVEIDKPTRLEEYFNKDKLIPFVQNCALYKTTDKAIRAHFLEILTKMITMELDLESRIESLTQILIETQTKIKEHVLGPHASPHV